MNANSRGICIDKVVHSKSLTTMLELISALKASLHEGFEDLTQYT